MNEYDLLIVGAGIFGITIAQKAASDGKKVLVIDKRDHIGGNAASYFDEATGIEIHKYGAHLFHTSNQTVWEYVNQFTKFNKYVHKVYTVHKGETFPMPINLGTINQFFRSNLSPDQAKAKIFEQAGFAADIEPKNLDEQGTKLIGRPLYEAFVMNYTKKQWQTDTKDLSPEIIKRLPVRYNYDNRYFNDIYEGLPVDGYCKMFEKMLDSPNIEIKLGVDFFDENEMFSKSKAVGAIPIIYTGPIDRYFDYSQGDLGWRTVNFQYERIETEDFQGTSVMNYADLDPDYTRIIEYKHFNPERKYKKTETIIAKEFSSFAKRDDEPYYPINTAEDQEKLQKYQQLADSEKNVFFGGRLGQYRYFDMHQVFDQALQFYEDKIYQILR